VTETVRIETVREVPGARAPYQKPHYIVSPTCCGNSHPPDELLEFYKAGTMPRLLPSPPAAARTRRTTAMTSASSSYNAATDHGYITGVAVDGST
jgi:hypothetical protein